MTFANATNITNIQKNYAYYYDECFNSTAWDVRNNGVASNALIIGNMPDNPGVFQLTTGTDTNGVASILYSGLGSNTGNYSLLSSKSFVYTAYINIETLATVTDDYDYYIGQNDGWRFGFPSNGVYFRYLRSSSLNWLCVTNKAATATSTDSGIPVTTGWHTMRIEGTPSSINFYIDDVLAATNTTNLPTATYNLNMMMIVKTAGTTSINCYQDYFNFIQNVSR